MTGLAGFGLQVYFGDGLVKFDDISEITAGHGVTIDGMSIKDGGATVTDSTFGIADNGDATKVLRFQASGITTGTTRTKTVQDTNATLAEVGSTTSATAPAFTGTAPTTATTNAFTGTGFATAGQVVTTSDNQTMTLNQCAGMWLITATQAPCLILSNTAVTGAPAVLTVFGLAPTTAAEDYKILRAPTPAGSVASHTHTNG